MSDRSEQGENGESKEIKEAREDLITRIRGNGWIEKQREDLPATEERLPKNPLLQIRDREQNEQSGDGPANDQNT